MDPNYLPLLALGGLGVAGIVAGLLIIWSKRKERSKGRG